MICKYCGTDNPKENTSCKNCLQKLDDDSLPQNNISASNAKGTYSDLIHSAKFKKYAISSIIIISVIALILVSWFLLYPLILNMSSRRGENPHLYSNSALTSSGSAVEEVKDRKVILDLSFGTREGNYSGLLVNGLPCGQGSFRTVNNDSIGWIYQGNWINGHMNGQGYSIWDNGWYKSGEFENDFLTTGDLYKDSNLIYSGGFKDDIYHGEGILNNRLGQLIFKGSFDSGYLKESEQERMKRAQDMKSKYTFFPPNEYNTCINNPEEFKGQNLVIHGDIASTWLQSDNDPAAVELLVNYDTYTDCEFYVQYRYGLDEKQFKVGDFVYVFGTIIDIADLVEQDGAHVIRPIIEANFIMLKDD